MGKHVVHTCDAKGCDGSASIGKLKGWFRVVVGVAPMVYSDAAGVERYGSPPPTRFKTVCSADCADTLIKNFAIDNDLVGDE